MYVGRYDNGSGYMEWAGRPVDSMYAAKDQVKGETWTARDVVEVEGGRELSIVASAPLGQEWKEA